MNLVRVDENRDRVAVLISALLKRFEARGMGVADRVRKEGSIVISFGDFRAEGGTEDIALVRLACAMMDDDRYTQPLLNALRGTLESGKL